MKQSNVISFNDRIKNDSEFAERMEYNRIKSSVRHPIINSSSDIDPETMKILLQIKHDIFNGEDIFLSGSRIKGTWLSEEEYNLYSQIYSNIKKSDYDIRSNSEPVGLHDFEKKYNIKIDYQKGSTGIKI